MIDWLRLEPYEGYRFRSFEELCYQVAKGRYGKRGEFTPIDDSGGGDSVEFYLTLHNGDQWGWQAKFYYPNKRLSASNRKMNIKNSLCRACLQHPHLKKWFLCTPTNLTTTENSWFENILPRSIPQNMNTKLIHWGDSEFQYWLSQPRFNGKRFYFFGELELTLDWFQTQFGKQQNFLKDTFNPFLHTETHIDAHIHALLGDEVFASYIKKEMTLIAKRIEEYGKAVVALDESLPDQIKWDSLKPDLLKAAYSLQKALDYAFSQVRRAYNLLSERRLGEVQRVDWQLIVDQIEEANGAYQEIATSDISKLAYTGKKDDKEQVEKQAVRILIEPILSAEEVVDTELGTMVDRLDLVKQADFHILGDAGVGKTHISSHICYERLKSGLPSVFVMGRQFTTDQPLSRQLLRIFDIPATYSWNDFLQALDTAAETYHTRIPLIIDGLNEATNNGVFSNVWRVGLSGLIHEIAKTKNVVLITTCRTTYKEATWPSNVPRNVEDTRGFEAWDVEAATQKYFKYYKIEADITDASLSQFEHPIYLRIFCESTNPTRREEKHVYVSEQALFEVFDAYLKQCNQAVCERLKLHARTLVVLPVLNKMGKYLWEHHDQNIPLEELVKIADEQPLRTLNWESSEIKAILDEGLLVCRDWREQGEVVYFTFGLLGGYLIAQYLIQEAGDDIEHFIQSEKTNALLFNTDFRTLHPLHDDIRRCLAALIPIKLGLYLHILSKNSIARRVSVESLFEIPPSYVNEDCMKIIAHLFEEPRNRIPFLKLAESTVIHVDHPLNVPFWSERLRALPMAERDTSWTEYMRENVKRFEKIVARFELTCQGDESLTEKTKKRLHLLAEYVMWVLTSTVRPLRDKATRALYYYGRRFPRQFLELMLRSLKINDPYVPERTFAAMYGVAMARQYDFEDPSFAESVLPVYGRKLYDAMFKPHAPHATTHMLARDYARRTIDIALIHHPGLLTAKQRECITPPFKEGGIRKWGKSKDRDEGKYRDGNAPIGMDFGNYTIGRLVRDRRNYDYEHEDYKYVLAAIFWRIYGLGYSLGTFGEIDKLIARGHWQYDRTRYAGATERYGKKYSWIAFCELAGFRQDKGLLGELYRGQVRISDADIDPSFPIEVQDYNLVQADFLGDRSISVEKWILDGDLPNTKSYLVVDKLCGQSGPWVVLDGYATQQDIGVSRRGLFFFIRCFIVESGEAEQIVKKLKQRDGERQQLPDVPEDYYTYAGEIPWCDTYYPNNLDELSFVIHMKSVVTPTKRPMLLQHGKPISKAEEKDFWNNVMSAIGKGDSKAMKAAIEKHGLELRSDTIRVRSREPEYQTFRAFIPVRNNNWEHYHSTIIPGRDISTPAKEIADRLGLCGQPQTLDLFEKSGKTASITFSHGDRWHTGEKFTYLRQDLLDRFLGLANTKIVWVIWGERGFFSDDLTKSKAFAKKHHSYKVFQDVKTYGNIKEC